MPLAQQKIYWESRDVPQEHRIVCDVPAGQEGRYVLPAPLRQRLIEQGIARFLLQLAVTLAKRGSVLSVQTKFYPPIEEGRNCFILQMHLLSLEEDRQYVHDLVMAQLESINE